MRRRGAFLVVQVLGPLALVCGSALVLATSPGLAYQYQRSITVNANQVTGGPLAGFPMLVQVTDLTLRTVGSGGHVQNSNGYDIIFMGRDDTTCGGAGASPCSLAHEIERYVPTTGELIAWVRVPSINNATVIYMFYGDASVSSPTENKTAVWSTNYNAVWHLRETGAGTAGEFKDSTSNANNGQGGAGNAAATPTPTPGKIGTAQTFDGSNDFIQAPGLLGTPASATVSAWVNLTAADTDGAEVLSLGDCLGLRLDDKYLNPRAAEGFFYVSGNTWNMTSAGASYAGTGWHYFAYVCDAVNHAQSIFVDGVQRGSTTFPQPINYVGNGANTTIGRNGNGGTTYDLRGVIDELRVASSPRTPGWLATEYKSQNAPASFFALGGEDAMHSISGTIFEDVNYGGGGGRNKPASSGVGRSGARVELFDGTGAYVASTTTNDPNGDYSFTGLSAGSYTVRVVTSSVTSSRTGYVAGLLPVMTYRTNASSGTAVDVTDYVGGQDPATGDAGNAASGWILNAATGIFSGSGSGKANAFAPVAIIATDLTGVDFGWNFDTIVNTNDTGQGSLRQFILNSSALGGEASLAQSGFRKDANNANTALPAGQETSIFMISDGAAHPGLRGGVANQLTSGVAVIRLNGNPWPTITGANTVLDGTTQTVNVGDLNPGQLGAGGVVGVDGLTLAKVYAPEVQITSGATKPSVGLEINADNVALRGVSIYGFGTADFNNGHMTIRVTGGSNLLFENNVVGASATSFTDPRPAVTSKGNLIDVQGGGGTIQNNLIGYASASGLGLANGVTAWTVSGNEFRGNAVDWNFCEHLVSQSAAQLTVSGNLFVDSRGSGLDVYSAIAADQFVNNTITHNGLAGAGETAGFIIHGAGGLIRKNILNANTGNGVMAPTNAAAISIRSNSIYGNGTGAGIGIDLLTASDSQTLGTAPYVTINDSGDTDTGGNGLLNFPIVSTATIVAGNLVLTGYARPGSVIELFVAAPDPRGFGQGQTWKMTLTEGGTGAGGDDPYADTDAGTGTYGPGAINGIAQGTDTTNKFRFTFPVPSGVTAGTVLTATATLAGNTSEFSGNVTVATGPADLALTKTDNPDPAPAGGELLYTLVITNNGPNNATNVVLTDTLPASVTLVSATPNQGSCSGTGPVTCNLGGILNAGTASVEILVVTGGAGSITNNASVTATEPDPTPANNAASATTTVVSGGTTDIPLTLYKRIHGFIDSTVTGGTLRTSPNTGNPCLVGASSTAPLSGIPNSATVVGAYLYWAGSGSTVDNQVTLDAAGLTADRTWTARYVLAPDNYDFFGGFKDVTAYVQGKRNGNYTFSGLTVTTGNPYCSLQAVLAGWALIVIYEDTSATGKTLVLYDGFDITRNGSSAYVLSGIYASPPPEGKARFLVWEGDETLSGATESLVFNGTSLSDALNPVNNVYNSTINTLGLSNTYGVDLDSFDVSSLVHARDTLATATVNTGPDLVILNAVALQVKTNIIVGTVFEDVNYGGGAGRNLATAVAGAPSFTVPRPGATVELYDATGALIRTTTTDVSGGYGFAGLVDGNYTVRVVNSTVTSSRPGAVGTLRAMQTYRTDASTGTAVAMTDEVGGTSPKDVDGPANPGSANLGSFIAQSKAPAQVITGISVTDVDFGYSFDTIVNTNDTGQGSLRQFLTNANTLGNANLAQSGRPAAIDNAVFMLADGTARPGLRASYPTMFAGGLATMTPASALPTVTDPLILDAQTQPGWTSAPIVELNGTSAGAGVSGLTITAGGSTVRGLVVNRFAGSGVSIATSGGDTVAGNYIGTNAAGAAASANGQSGVIITGTTNNTIGGTAAGAGNLISGNAGSGVAITGAGAMGNVVQGNTIGLSISASALPNGADGVNIAANASNNTIGGTIANAANVIASNTGRGVNVVTGTGNAIETNSIYANGNVGIDLGGDGTTANNGTKNAGLPNSDMDFPLLTRGILAGPTLSVAGYIGSSPHQATFANARVEIFKSDNDASGHGEGPAYLGFLTADANGDFAGSLTVAGLAVGDAIAATATDGANNTSEFGSNAPVRSLAIVKQAFRTDGTPLASGAVAPKGSLIKFLLYVNNPGAALSDVSLKDALDPSFAYVAGSLRYSGTTAACAALTCTSGEEAAIFAAADSGTAGSDAIDGDVVGVSGSTVYSGNQDVGNLQLDIAAAKVWALVFTVRIR